MPELKTTVTRKELYDKVWSIPVYLAAREFRIAVNSLKKICNNFEVPMPYKGYWSGIKAQHRPERTPLSPAKRWQPHDIVIIGRERPQPRLQKLGREKGIDVPAILISTKGPFVHAFTVRTRDLLRKARTDDAGILVSERAFLDHLRVSAKTLPRALRILDALFVAFEREPFGVFWPEGSNTKVEITVLGERFRFSMAEIILYTRHKPTAAEAFRQRQDWFWRPPKWNFKLTQHLQLVIEGTKGERLRRIWSDGKRPLERCLEEFLVSLLAVARELKRQREEGGTWRQRWDRMRSRELQQEQQQNEETARLALWTKHLADWTQAQDMRRLMAATKEAVQKIEDVAQQQRGLSLINWLDKFIGSIDPVKNISRSIDAFRP